MKTHVIEHCGRPSVCPPSLMAYPSAGPAGLHVGGPAGFQHRFNVDGPLEEGYVHRRCNLRGRP